jgi:uncharacterized protein YndB with AHSA1/START domain
MSDILLEVVIEADPERVYRAITDQAGLAGWWTPEVVAEARVGAVADFTFTGGPAGRFTIKMEVAALEPGHAVAWNVRQGAPDWAATRVTWDLSPADSGTRVRFGHRNFASAEGSLASAAYAWAWYLASLKDYVETGAGRPGELNARRPARV